MTDEQTISQGIVERDKFLVVLDQEFDQFCEKMKAVKDENRDKWIPIFLAKKEAQRKAEIATLQEMLGKLIDHANAEYRATHYRWGQAAQNEVDRQIEAAGGKKKSINTPYGRLGYRTTKGSLQIDDLAAAKEWAVDNLARNELIQAISGLNKTPLIDNTKHLADVDKVTGEVVTTSTPPPGCTFYPAAEKFYPAAPKPKQITGDNYG